MASIRVTCDACGAQLKVSEDKAGKVGKCPKCGGRITVPMPAVEFEEPVVPEPEWQAPVEAPVRERAAPASAQDVLAGYQRAAQPSASGVKKGFGAMKARARAARLKWNTKKLRTALDDQSERLGVLTVQHQPAGVDISAEVSEISRVQTELNEKRATLESLRGTKGSGSVVKELKAEEAQLVARQRELMMAIGAKADAVRPEMPGAAGHYSAMDAVRAQLGQKEAQLAELEGQIGPVADAGTLNSLKKPALGVLAVVVAVGVLYFAATFAWGLLGGSGLSRYASYIPKKTQAVLYYNIRALRDSDILEDLGIEDMLEELLKEAPLGLDLDMDNVRETFMAITKDGPVSVLRTEKDEDLEDLASEKPDDTKTYKGKDYIVVGLGYYGRQMFLAKTGKATYCIAADEDALKDVLKRLDEGEKEELSDDLRQVLGKVKGHDHFFGASGDDGPFPGAEGAKAVGIGVSIGRSVSGRAVLVFDDDDDAEKFADMVEEQLEKAVEEGEEELDDPPDDMPDEMIEAMEIGLKVIKGVSVSRSGDTVRLSAGIKRSDIRRIREAMGDDMMKEMMREAMRELR